MRFPEKDSKMKKKDKIFLLCAAIIVIIFLVAVLVFGNLNNDRGEVQAPGPRETVVSEDYEVS